MNTHTWVRQVRTPRRFRRGSSTTIVVRTTESVVGSCLNDTLCKAETWSIILIRIYGLTSKKVDTMKDSYSLLWSTPTHSFRLCIPLLSDLAELIPMFASIRFHHLHKHKTFLIYWPVLDNRQSAAGEAHTNLNFRTSDERTTHQEP